MPNIKTTVESFWARVDKSKECWIYQGKPDKDGYCHASFEGVSTTAHRIAFFMSYGYWPVIGCHICDNPPCVRPSHIVDGTNTSNRADSYAKGRIKKPTKSKFDWQQIDEILFLSSIFNYSQSEIARVYKTVPSNICRIVNGKAWKKERYQK